MQQLHAHNSMSMAQRPSELTDRLLELWGWGLLSTPQLQLLAEGAQLDGLSSEQINSLASVGSRGAHPGNMRRDLMRSVLGDLPAVFKPAMVAVPYVKKKSGTVDFMQLPVMLPSDVLRALYTDYRTVFMEMLGQGPKWFWDHVNNEDPRLLGHPMCTELGWENTCLPIVLHIDGAKYTNKDSMLVISWTLLQSSGNTWDTHFLVAAFPKSCRAVAALHGHDTMHSVWEYIKHDFNAVMSGTHAPLQANGLEWPEGSEQAHYAGTPIAGGYKGVVWNLTADWDALANELGMPHFNGPQPCWLCRADRADNNFRDVSAHAAWRNTLWPVLEGNMEAPSTHPAFSIHGLSRFCVLGDLMHTADLGTTQNLLGSALYELLQEGPYHGSLTKRTEQLWAEIQGQYSLLDTPSRLGSLQVIALKPRPSDWSCLTGVKAADTRHLTPVVLRICQAHNDGSEHHAHRIAALESMDGIYNLLEEHGFFLPTPAADEALSMYERFALHYNWLTNAALARGELAYNMTSKMHLLYHIIHSARWINPRAVWAYSFEDYIGKIVLAAHACTAGTPAHKVPEKLLQNWSTVMAMRLQRRLR